MENRIAIILIALTAFVFELSAQEVYRIDNSDSKIVVEGTSSLHDWEMKAQNIDASLSITNDQDKITDIKDVRFSLESKNLVSDNSIMDKKAQDALKAKKYKSIKFDPEGILNFQSEGNKLSGVAKGTLFIAGKSQSVEIPFSGNVNGNDSLKVTGKKKIKMSDFGIEPPTAMLGTLKTGNEVTINFNLEFTRN